MKGVLVCTVWFLNTPVGGQGDVHTVAPLGVDPLVQVQ